MDQVADLPAAGVDDVELGVAGLGRLSQCSGLGTSARSVMGSGRGADREGLGSDVLGLQPRVHAMDLVLMHVDVMLCKWLS